VTDAVYIANDENSVPLSSFLTSEKLGSAIGEDSSLGYGEQLASSSDADGIRLLVQGDNNILYPLVVPVNEEPGSLYSELLGKIVSDKFTKVPTF
jgi:hypothetical protein